MGNRAVITTKENWANDGVGIYLHWNGGRDSVEAFLEYCKLKGIRTGSYGFARLCQVIGNFFGGTLSIGIDTLWHLDCDNYDNGVYIIDNWEIVDRRYFDGAEQSGYDRKEMLCAIDEAQPEKERLGSEFLGADVVETASLKIGDVVFKYNDLSGTYDKCAVIGLGDAGRICNGQDAGGVPYVDLYSMSGHPETNINNYLREKEYRKASDL